MDNHNPITSNKAKWYETRRNELLKLLNRTSEMQIQEKYAHELDSIRKKCLENQFEIVLVGEFQGGKSTTFNALCDGRDLSPRGLGGGGIKTSAAIISAQNISDGETKNGREEWAEITFKTKYEIQKGMFDLLHAELVEEALNNKSFFNSFKLREDDFRVKMSMAETFAEILNLDLPAHRNAVKKIIQLFWAQWQQDKSSLDEDTKDRLRIATLQERFYGTSEYQKMLSKTIVGLDEFQPMIAFPCDWIIRWQDGNKASFSLQEAAFVFIARTLLRIKSDNLAKVGCRITDCPGLFANAYDTAVAQLAISNSDAVWYLIGGEKQIGEKDLRSLDFIKSMGMIPKVTASVNLKGKHEQKMTQIFPVTKAILQEHGFDFPVLKYNAKLAFLATQGKRIYHGESFSEYETRCMRIDSDNGEDTSVPIEEMWIEMVNETGVYTGIKELKSLDEISEESVQSVMASSNIDEILSFLNQEIITKKSKSILIDNGSKKAADALQEYEGQLKIAEDAALQDVDAWQKKVEESTRILKEFVANAQELIEDSSFSSEKELLSEGLARDLIKDALDDDFIDKLADLIAQALIAHGSEFYWTPNGFREVIMQDVNPQIEPLFKNTILRVLESWKDHRNSSVNWTTFETREKKIHRDILKLWKEKVEKHDYIKDLSLGFTEDDCVDSQLAFIQNAVFNNNKLQDMIESERFGITTLLLGFIALIPVYIVEGIAQLFGKSVLSEDGAAKKKEMKKNIIEKIAPDIKTLDFQAKIYPDYQSHFVDAHNKILESMQKALGSIVSRFQQEHVDPAKRSLTESEEKRKAIAEENHKIRVEQIEPMRMTIRAFEQQVTMELNLK